MREQLNRASAVIAVLDYTQLKSESDAEVRSELLEIAEVSRGRLSVFVNKFDQKDRHSDGEDAVKSLVANELLKGKITVEDVYPVSSKYAYLANRARTELALNKSLPDPNQHLWVEDFAEEGLGKRWKRDIDNLERVNEAIDELWEDSLFDIPLERVIQKAHAQAALLAIDSAASKLVDSSNRIKNFLVLRETALKKSSEELMAYINDLQQQKNDVDALEVRSKNQLGMFLDQLKEDFSMLSNEANNELKNSLNKYFKEGRLQAKEKANKRSAKDNKKKDKAGGSGIFGVIQDLFSNGSVQSKNKKIHELHFDPEDNVIDFDDAESAKELLEKIEGAVKFQYEIVNKAMRKSLRGINKELNGQSLKLEKEAGEILETLSSRMNKDGFDLKLTLPRKRAINIKLDNAKILGGLVEEKTRKVTRHRRQSGAWGTVCSWFGTDDWGWESYRVDEEYFSVDINKIRNKVLMAAGTVFENANLVIENNIIFPVKQSCDVFFDELKKRIDGVRGDLLQGLEDGNRSKQEQAELAQHLAGLKREISDSDSDSQGLRKEAEISLSQSEFSLDAVDEVDI
jgi:hypothetical protein